MPPATGTDTSARTALIPTSDGTSLTTGSGTGTAARSPSGRSAAPPLLSSLTFRIFLGTAAAVVAVLGVTLLATWISAQRAADAAVDRGLRATTRAIVEQLRAQQAQMIGKARVFAENPALRSLLDSPDRIESGNMLDQAQVAEKQLDATWVQLTDSAGVLLAKSNEPGAPQRDLSRSPLISGALGGDERAAFGVAGDTSLIQVVAVPVFGASQRVSAVLMAARVLDNSIATTIGGSTGSDVVMFALDSLDHPRIVGATSGLAAHLPSLRPALEGGRMGAMTGAMGSMMGSMMGEPGDSSGFRRADVTIDGQRFVGAGEPLRQASGHLAGGFIALRSRADELRTFDRLRDTILLCALGGLLVAFVLSAAVARQIARPVRLLAEATRHAAEGDYAVAIPSAGRDEIGRLADAFRQLLADLREKQALVDFLESGGGGQRTVPLRAAITPTMQAAVMGSDHVLEPGRQLAGRYEIRGVLGIGGMGVVYRAMDRELGDVVAIKTLKSDIVAQDPAALERFKSEIRLARRISHRNVVRTHDLGETGGLYYITMELVEGKSLKDLVASRGRLPSSVVLSIGKQLCRALETAHEAGVIHRDIKPQNMVLEPSGVLKVMDFGIARLATRSAGYTQAGMVVGTPEYMAPEQLLGDDIDARADLYSAGVVMYECLTGRLPFEADSVITLIAKVLEETPPPPTEVAPDVAPALSAVVMRAMARDIETRYRTAADLYEALERFT